MDKRSRPRSGSYGSRGEHGSTRLQGEVAPPVRQCSNSSSNESSTPTDWKMSRRKTVGTPLLEKSEGVKVEKGAEVVGERSTAEDGSTLVRSCRLGGQIGVVESGVRACFVAAAGVCRLVAQRIALRLAANPHIEQRRSLLCRMHSALHHANKRRKSLPQYIEWRNYKPWHRFSCTFGCKT